MLQNQIHFHSNLLFDHSTDFFSRHSCICASVVYFEGMSVMVAFVGGVLNTNSSVLISWWLQENWFLLPYQLHTHWDLRTTVKTVRLGLLGLALFTRESSSTPAKNAWLQARGDAAEFPLGIYQWDFLLLRFAPLDS